MNIFDFITQDEIDDLPDNDPHAAFVTFVRIAQRRLGERVKELDGTEDGWRDVNQAQQGFMNITVAAAKKFGVEPFASSDVPRLKDFNSDDDRQFRADLDHYMTQLVLDASGPCLTKESLLGFPCRGLRASLAHAHRNFHLDHPL